MCIMHHRKLPLAPLIHPFGSRFPLAAHESTGAVFPHAGLWGYVPVVDVFAAAVAADVGDSAFVVVGGGDAGVAVAAAVVLAGCHEGGEGRVGGLGGWWHVVIGVGGVGVGNVGLEVGRLRGLWVGGVCSVWGLLGEIWGGSLGGGRGRVCLLSQIVHYGRSGPEASMEV